jgi:hypothetical protein
VTRTLLQTKELLELLKKDQKRAYAKIRAALDEAQGRTAVAAEALDLGERTMTRLLQEHPELRDYASELRARHNVPGNRGDVAIDPAETRKRLEKGLPVRRTQLAELAGVTRAALAAAVKRALLDETDEGVTAASAKAWLKARAERAK